MEELFLYNIPPTVMQDVRALIANSDIKFGSWKAAAVIDQVLSVRYGLDGKPMVQPPEMPK